MDYNYFIAHRTMSVLAAYFPVFFNVAIEQVAQSIKQW